jgi:hypothetical protein
VCPRCSSAREPDQEYCLDCGLRLPPGHGGLARFRRLWLGGFGWYPGDWALGAFLALLIAAGGAAGAIMLGSRSRDAGTTFAALSAPAAPAAAKARRTAREGPSAPATWPTAEPGWTVVLLSVPRERGAEVARARAARAARVGLPDAGYLVSDRFASLHPGYYVVFAGVYSTRDEAEAAVPSARAKGFGGAYVRPVTP